MRILGKLYSSAFRTSTRKGRFLETSFPSILHSYSIPIPRTRRSLITYTTDAYTQPKFCNIVNLLSTDKRDFLIRNNNQKVKIDSLNGKFVALLYMQYPTHRNVPHPLGLLEAYKTLYPKGDFEVVFVAYTENGDDKEDSYEWFNKYFLNMPWLGVPFSDFETRKRVRDVFFLFGSNFGSECVVVDKLGNVVCPYARYLFDIHGANLYPFTELRTTRLSMEKDIDITDFSLKELLSSPSRDYVLTRNGDKVLIADLESKVVGLYFYDWLTHHGASDLIRSVYEKLKANGMDFEIVFLNRYSRGGYPDEESFNKNFEKMPWLAVPFGDRTCEKLARNLALDIVRSCGTALVIVKPGELCELYGMTILQDYGAEAYPFTVEKAAELEIEKLSLFSLFDAEGQEFVIQNDNNKTKIKVSKLKTKSACMLLAANVPCQTLSHLANWYNKMKKVYNGFEMIYVSGCKSVTEFDDMLKQMPSAWLALPFGAGHKISKMIHSWGEGDAIIAVFKDGKYFTKNFLKDEDDWELLSNSKYPYNADVDTVEEKCFELKNWYNIE